MRIVLAWLFNPLHIAGLPFSSFAQRTIAVTDTIVSVNAAEVAHANSTGLAVQAFHLPGPHALVCSPLSSTPVP